MNHNILALNTIAYIWSHPNSRHKQIQSLGRFTLWQLYKRLTHRIIDINLVSGIKIRCYPDSTSASAVFYCGLYDYDDMNFLRQFLRQEDSFIDIGANVGVYSLLAASKITDGSIHSFEVLPKNYARLQENIAINGLKQIKTYQIAVSDRTGTISLNLAEGDCMPFITDQVTDKMIPVATDTLDNLLQNQDITNLTLAKMDIEGAEILALKGASYLLQHQRPHVWIMEINNTVSHFGHQQQDLVDFLANYGYHIYSYSADTNQLTPITLERKQGNNVLAIADSALDLVQQRLAEIAL